MEGGQKSMGECEEQLAFPLFIQNKGKEQSCGFAPTFGAKKNNTTKQCDKFVLQPGFTTPGGKDGPGAPPRPHDRPIYYLTGFYFLPLCQNSPVSSRVWHVGAVTDASVTRQRSNGGHYGA